MLVSLMPLNTATAIRRERFYISYVKDIAIPTKEDLVGFGIYAVFIVKKSSVIYIYISSGTAKSGSTPGIRDRLFRYEKGYRVAKVGLIRYGFKEYIASKVIALDT